MNSAVEWLTFLVMLAEDMVKALLYKPLCGGLCWVLAEFMVKWRWDNWSQNKCLKQDPENAAGSLLLSYMYAAASNWDLSSMCDGRERKEVKKQPGACQTWVKWLMRCIHLWWMIKTNLRLMESMQKWKNCQDSCIMQGVCQIQKKLLHHVDEEG